MNAQEINLPKQPKASDKYVYCFVSCDEEEGKWLKIIKTPNEKDVLKLQQKLNYLGYDVVETGLIDFQTKKQLKLFNIENKIGCHDFYTYETQYLLRKQYKRTKNES